MTLLSCPIHDHICLVRQSKDYDCRCTVFVLEASHRQRRAIYLTSSLGTKLKQFWIRLKSPPPGWVRFGSLRRLTPISTDFGYDRGQPIDRYYIENFLSSNSTDIRGRVLEIGDDTYTRRFGGDRVIKSDVLAVRRDNPKATIVADLSKAENIPSDAFDCIIFTQTLQYIYDVNAAVATLARILKPGGVTLATLPGISQISPIDMDRWGEYWRFTTLSARRLFEDAFSLGHADVEAHGNVLSAIAFLHGLAAEELKNTELDYFDRNFELVITVRAVRPK